MTASPQVRDTSVNEGQSTDNAEVGGSIPPSPTKSLVAGHFSSKLGAAESC